MKRTQRAAKVFAGFWGVFLGLRVIFLVARGVGVIGAFETIAEWAGHPDAIYEFEAWADTLLVVIFSYMGVKG